MAQGSPFANHTWGDISVTEAPGCATEGKGLRCCQYCGAEQETAVPATGNHSWNAGKVTTKPTCTEPGVKTFTCTVCSQQKTEPVAAKGHYWEVTEILTPATEDEHGTAKYTCKTCGATKEAVLCASEIFIDTPAEGHWAHTPIDWAFFGGITTGTKLGHAVVRNRVRRQMREIYRLNRDKLARGKDIVVVARVRAVSAGYHAMERDFLRCARKLGLLTGESGEKRGETT
jgi:RNase P protein component